MISHLPYVSIIVPLHNEQNRLRQAVHNIIRYGEKYLVRYEIILVDNGSTDMTYAITQELTRTFRPVRALQLDHRSKAHAVRYGMMKAVGQARYMCDVDLSTPIDQLYDFMKMLNNGWDIVIGSREHPDSQVRTSFKRWFIGRTFHALVLAYTGLDYRDTQCGFKLFTAQAAEDIFSRTECTSMAFDVEALYLAKKLGYFCTEIPVIWKNDADSRVRLVRDSWSMLRELASIREIHRDEKKVTATSEVTVT